MADKPIFLTGASGNVGRAVLAELVARGREVIALVRSSPPALKGYRPLIGDLARIYDLAGEIAAAGGIIHCASPRSQDRHTVLTTDIEGTGRLLDLWGTGPFVYASSQTVYGVPRDVLREDSALDPGGWYDLGKICNEHQVALRATECGLPGVNLRLPLVFSDGPRRRDRQYLPEILDALRGGRPFLFGGEEAFETAGSVFIGADDLGRAITDSLGIARSGPYNLAGGFCTWRELIESMARHAGLKPLFRLRAGAVARDDEYRMPQSRSAYDCSRFTAATGFSPRQSLDDVVRRFVDAERQRVSS